MKQTTQKTKIKRRYDTARPPFDRVCATQAISHQRQAQLAALRDNNVMQWSEVKSRVVPLLASSATILGRPLITVR